MRYEGRYAPPSLQGTLTFPARAGGNSIIKPQVADQPVAFACRNEGTAGAGGNTVMTIPAFGP
ncbi:hypothetical protein GCM10011402_30530 [Paracoccus acridae]|uniref:Uncharacterized protein n=1 Tax=Paracoccus acridae TaxID=1795310 RepID=A0ABQ1VKX2_9RHOB|nr:hypothetical protein [Paracoccus acridae]GGF75697.1 hypothetical protein GCM10011402_30530 [Paracoccus acridae]